MCASVGGYKRLQTTGTINKVLLSLVKQPRPKTRNIIKACIHLTWHVRIWQPILSKEMQHQPRPAHIGCGECVSVARCLNWPTSENISQGMCVSGEQHFSMKCTSAKAYRQKSRHLLMYKGKSMLFKNRQHPPRLVFSEQTIITTSKGIGHATLVAPFANCSVGIDRGPTVSFVDYSHH